MVVTGAKVSEDGIIETYDNDDEALDAVENGVAVCVNPTYPYCSVRVLYHCFLLFC